MNKKRKSGFNWKKLAVIVLIIAVIYPVFFLFFPAHMQDMYFMQDLRVTLFFVIVDLFWLVVGVWLIWDYNNKFVNYLDSIVKWEKQPYKRLLIQIGGTALIDFAILAIGFILNILINFIIVPEVMNKIKEHEAGGMMLQAVFYYCAVFIIYNFIYISIFFYQKWVKSLLESEKLKFENLHAQLHALQNQVNPHFLFNSLNTLTAVIEEDKNSAIEFVQQLSSFYRYILQRQSSHLVPIIDELNFLHSYIYLQRKRFGDNFHVDLKLEKEVLKKTIPTFTLQLLLENAFKHNIVSSEKPLNVSIYTINGGQIALENNLQKKQHTAPSTEHGLQNIKNRFEILGSRQIEVTETDSLFKVVVPLFEERGRNEYFDN